MLTDPSQLLVLACALQFLQVPGMIIGQRVLAWGEDLSRLSPTSRRLVLALGVGIMLYVCGSGAIGLLYPRAIVTSDVGRALCVLQAVAWSVRALLQLFVIGPSWPLHGRWLGRSLAVVYSSLALSYSLICWLSFAARASL